jgi:Fe-S cluster biogenesis protein NfuA
VPHFGKSIMSKSAVQSAPHESAASLREQVEQVLNLIRPAVQSDGGDIELVDVDGQGVVRVRLHGACVGCPSSTMTLQAGIERNLKQRIPAVTCVQAVN